MSTFRRRHLIAFLVAALFLAVTGCTASLGNEITREPKPTRSGTRYCGTNLWDLAGCVVEALIPDSVAVSPFPSPPDSTVVRRKQN